VIYVGSLFFENQKFLCLSCVWKGKADEDILSLNLRREIKLRSLAGLGVRCQILNNKKYWLKFSISSEYEQTKFAKTKFNLSEYNGSQSINTFRSTFWVNVAYILFEKKVIVNHKLYF
jgi:hypothetical protein